MLLRNKDSVLLSSTAKKILERKSDSDKVCRKNEGLRLEKIYFLIKAKNLIV
jgi:hypothetical protein